MKEKRSRVSLGGRAPALMVFLFISLCFALFLNSYHYPPLLDYPNHLARMHIINHAQSPNFAEFFDIRYRLVPNLAMDVVVPPLSKLFGVHFSGKLFILLCVITLTSSVLALSASLHGDIQSVALAGNLLIFNLAFEFGFLNFLLSVGLALWAFALHIRLESRPGAATVVGSLLCLLLFFCHLFGLVVYAVLILGYSTARFVRHPLVILRHAFQFVPSVIILAYYAGTNFSGSDDSISSISQLSAGWILHQIHTSLSGLYVGSGLPAKMTALFFFGLALAYPATRTWPLSIRMSLPLAGILSLVVILPSQTLSAANINWRFMVPFALIALGALKDPTRSSLVRKLIAASVVIIFLLQLFQANQRWRHTEGIQKGLLSATSALEPGDRVFPVFPSGGYGAAQYPVPYTHMICLAVIEKDIMVPILFSRRSQHTLGYRPPYQESLYSDTVYPSLEGLDWRWIGDRYDYIILLDHDGNVADWEKRIPLQLRRSSAANDNILLLEVFRESSISSLRPRQQ